MYSKKYVYCVYMYACTCVSLSVCMYVYIRACVHICTQVFLFIKNLSYNQKCNTEIVHCGYIRMYVHIYIRTYTVWSFSKFIKFSPARVFLHMMYSYMYVSLYLTCILMCLSLVSATTTTTTTKWWRPTRTGTARRRGGTARAFR